MVHGVVPYREVLVCCLMALLHVEGREALPALLASVRMGDHVIQAGSVGGDVCQALPADTVFDEVQQTERLFDNSTSDESVGVDTDTAPVGSVGGDVCQALPAQVLDGCNKKLMRRQESDKILNRCCTQSRGRNVFIPLCLALLVMLTLYWRGSMQERARQEFQAWSHNVDSNSSLLDWGVIMRAGLLSREQVGSRSQRLQVICPQALSGTFLLNGKELVGQPIAASLDDRLESSPPEADVDMSMAPLGTLRSAPLPVPADAVSFGQLLCRMRRREPRVVAHESAPPVQAAEQDAPDPPPTPEASPASPFSVVSDAELERRDDLLRQLRRERVAAEQGPTDLDMSPASGAAAAVAGDEGGDVAEGVGTRRRRGPRSPGDSVVDSDSSVTESPPPSSDESIHSSPPACSPTLPDEDDETEEVSSSYSSAMLHIGARRRRRAMAWSPSLLERPPRTPPDADDALALGQLLRRVRKMVPGRVVVRSTPVGVDIACKSSAPDSTVPGGGEGPPARASKETPLGDGIVCKSSAPVSTAPGSVASPWRPRTVSPAGSTRALPRC